MVAFPACAATNFCEELVFGAQPQPQVRTLFAGGSIIQCCRYIIYFALHWRGARCAFRVAASRSANCFVCVHPASREVVRYFAHTSRSWGQLCVASIVDPILGEFFCFFLFSFFLFFSFFFLLFPFFLFFSFFFFRFGVLAGRAGPDRVMVAFPACAATNFCEELVFGAQPQPQVRTLFAGGSII